MVEGRHLRASRLAAWATRTIGSNMLQKESVECPGSYGPARKRPVGGCVPSWPVGDSLPTGRYQVCEGLGEVTRLPVLCPSIAQGVASGARRLT